jgi:membrane dipeptidase
MSTATVKSEDSAAVEARAAAVHKESVVIDAMAVRGSDPPALVGGVTAMVITVGGTRPEHDTTFALRTIATQLDFIDFYADRVLLVRTAEDIERAKREGKLGLIFNMQGVSSLGVDLSLVRIFSELGVRSMQLTYMENSLAGSGCLETNDLGLTSFGRQVMRAMERTGILLDLSHVGRRTSLEALAYARRPVVFSHSNPAALFETPRNITDEEIKACAATGGIIGITPACAFFAPRTAPRPTLDDMVTHMVYVADLVGIDHVGVAHDTAPDVGSSPFKTASHFGSGFSDQLEGRPRKVKDVEGFEEKASFPKLTLQMARRGFSDDDIAKVLGANWMRVFREAWPPRPARAT